MTEYRETGYGSDRYPPRDGGGPDSDGTVYRGSARRSDDQESPSIQDDHSYGAAGSPVDPAASIRGRVWRPTRGPRAEGANQGYGAPERGWRTSDGGYRSPEGGWRAPYRPYDTGEWRRDQPSDAGPTSTGEIPPYSSGTGEIVRYTPPATGKPATYRAGPASGTNYPVPADRADDGPPHTGEIVRYRGTVGTPGYPPAGTGTPTTGPRHPSGGAPAHPHSGVPGYRDDVDESRHHPAGRDYSTGTGEMVAYRGGAAEPRHPGAAGGVWDARRGQRRLGGTGEIARYPGAANPRSTGETTRIPRQRPTSPANYPPSAPPSTPQRRALESGRRNDSPELYSYDPLTLGGGESPAMRYHRATESYLYDGGPGEPAPQPTVPDQRRGPRPPDPRAADPRAADPRTAGYEPRAAHARAAEAPGEGIPVRRPAERRYDQPPVRRAAARPQRFEGTYPSRSARSPRNVPMGRPGLGPDEDEEDAPGFFHTALVTTAWYTIPLLLYTMYVLTLDGSAQAGDGESPRESALNGLLGGMPQVGVALLTSLAVALLIRLISRGWRAATIGFAAAVVGGGVATVIFTALTG